jgi:hypothetical protein
VFYRDSETLTRLAEGDSESHDVSCGASGIETSGKTWIELACCLRASEGIWLAELTRSDVKIVSVAVSNK